jgi:hypothetical protein
MATMAEIPSLNATAWHASIAPAAAPSRRGRVWAAAAIGVAVAAYVIARAHAYPQWVADLSQSWVGARALLHGQDPYVAVGPAGTWMRLPWPLFYPLPAVLLMLPLAPLSIAASRAVFLGASSAWLAYVITRRDYWRLALFGSGAFLGAIGSGAWEPMLLAAALTPGASVVYLAKPNVGLALATALTARRSTIIGLGAAAALLIVSVIVMPGWIGEWRQALRSGTHLTGLITRPAGFVALGALARWRRAEARVVAAMALVPQTMMVQAALPLFLVPRGRAEMILLSLLSFIPLAIQLHAATEPIAFQTLTERTGTCIALFVYLPCVLMLLRRPNVGAALDEV